METDPVCGMDVDLKDGGPKAKYEGKTYYFCSTDCKREFLDVPDVYADDGLHEVFGDGDDDDNY